MLTVIYLWCLQAISGLIADARRVVNQARDEASNYRFTYSQPIPVKVGAPTDNVISCVKTQSPPPLFLSQHLVDRVSSFMHIFTLYGSVRPFGCCIMFGAYGAEGPQLYLADPSGVSWVGLFSLSIPQYLSSRVHR